MDYIEKEADLSPDGVYRYSLWRAWDLDLPTLFFIGLNPSTADADFDDPTIRRVVGFAQGFGCGSIQMLNLYAFRATQPKDMKAAADPVGPANDHVLSAAFRLVALDGHTLVAGWGAHAEPSRAAKVLRLALDRGAVMHHLGLTQQGHPKHPLYLAASTPLSVLMQHDLEHVA